MNKDKNGKSTNLASAERKIKSIMKKESIDEITIERQYLPEIFSADLLEISKHDGLPNLKPFVISYFLSKGISFDNLAISIRFKKMPAPEWVKKVLNGLSFIKYLNQLKWYELQSVGIKQPSFSDEQKENWNKQGFDYRLKIVLLGEPQFAMTALTKKFCINIINPSERLTNGVDFRVKTIELHGKKIQLQLWNIGSVERFKSLYDLILGVNGIIMIYLINDAEQVKRASEDIELVRKCIGGIPIFVALPNFSTFLGFSQFPELPSKEFRVLIERYRFIEITPEVGPIGEHALILFAKKILEGFNVMNKFFPRDHFKLKKQEVKVELKREIKETVQEKVNIKKIVGYSIYGAFLLFIPPLLISIIFSMIFPDFNYHIVLSYFFVALPILLMFFWIISKITFKLENRKDKFYKKRKLKVKKIYPRNVKIERRIFFLILTICYVFIIFFLFL